MSLKEREKTNEKKKSRAAQWAENESKGWESGAIKLPDGVSKFRIEDRKYRIDILPYVVGNNKRFTQKLQLADPGETHFNQIYFAHAGLGLSGKESYVCLEQTFNKKCPVCDYLRSGKASKEIENKMRAKKRILVNLRDLDNTAKGIQVWDAPFGGPKNPWFGEVLKNKINGLEKYHRFDELTKAEGGMSLYLTVAASKEFGPNVTNIEMVEREQDYKPSIMKKCAVLDQIVTELPYKELYAKLHPGEDEDVGDGDSGDDDVVTKGSDEDEDEDAVAAKMDDDDEDEKTEDDSDLEPAAKSDDDDTDDEDEKDKDDDEDVVKDDEDTDDEPEDDGDETEPAPKPKPKKKDEKPALKEKAAEASQFKSGMNVSHPKYGKVEFLEVDKKGMATVEDKNGDEHKVKVSELIALKDKKK